MLGKRGAVGVAPVSLQRVAPTSDFRELSFNEVDDGAVCYPRYFVAALLGAWVGGCEWVSVTTNAMILLR